MRYAVTIRAEFEALDDADARDRLSQNDDEIGETVDALKSCMGTGRVTLKLQRLADGGPPRALLSEEM